MRCPACGVEVVAAAMFCHKCGQRLDSANEAEQGRQDAEASPKSTAEVFEQAVASRRDSPNQAEEELWRGGYSPKAMLGSWAISASVSFVLFVGGIISPFRFSYYWLLLFAAMLSPWLYYLSVLCYRRLSVRYVLTSQRFIHERGLLRRVHDRIELLDVDDITFEQGLWERLVGVGTIRITSHDRSDPELALRGIEDVKRVAGIFDDARLVERRRRGLQVEQI